MSISNSKKPNNWKHLIIAYKRLWYRGKATMKSNVIQQNPEENPEKLYIEKKGKHNRAI